MSERRLYERVKIGVSCIIFADEDQNKEMLGTVLDISENGIAFFVDEPIDGIFGVGVGSVICFQYIDDYEIENDTKEAIICGEAKIIRMASRDNGTVIGCQVIVGEEYISYVEEKKHTSK